MQYYSMSYKSQKEKAAYDDKVRRGRYIYGRMFAVKTFKRLPKIVFEIRVMSQRRPLRLKKREKKASTPKT